MKLSENTKQSLTLAGIVLSVGICCVCAFGDFKDAAWGFLKNNIPLENVSAGTKEIESAVDSWVKPIAEKIAEGGNDFASEITAEIEKAAEMSEATLASLPRPTDFSAMEKCTVQRVVDGDTYVLDIGTEEKKVRLIGVDTPESVAPASYAKENTEEGRTVSEIVKGRIKAGDILYAEYDVSKTDKYGRMLAYLYFEDGTMVQDWLLENGYANIATYPPNVKYADHFAELVHTAAENKVGLWNGFFEEE